METEMREMTREEMESDIRDLIDRLNEYTKLYDEGHPAISDKEWDDMYFMLQMREHQSGIYFEDSPTQKINYQVVNELNKVKHSHPMLSLDKTKNINDIVSFIGERDYIVMAKMDGLTCSLTYENGRLVAAETRGNGEIGEDILHNALVVKNIPHRIANLNKMVIDGEIICDYKTFENFSNEYKNPRNFASGSIRLLDSKESAARGLSFIAWDCIEGSDREELNEKLFELVLLGFDVVPFIKSGMMPVGHLIDSIKSRCKEMGYQIDGAVVKYNNCAEYEAAGRTDHHFRGGLAFKFYDEMYETRIKDIEWTMGRTGVLTPVAIVEPVEIDGTIVERASLHNISIMEDLGIKEYGQLVAIYKANQIIPQIDHVVPEPTCDVWMPQNFFGIPTRCPVCGGETEIRQENLSKMLYCSNPACEGKLVNRLDHFCSKKGLDIKGLSKATLEKLIDWGYVKSYLSIFTLNEWREDWIKQPGFGVASVDKILNAIEEARETTLDKVIAAAGMPEIGSRVSKDLARNFTTWEDFRNADSYLYIDGIGEVMNDNLLNFNYDDLNFTYVVNQFLNIDNKVQASEEANDLEGMVFCITGKVHIFKNRAELQADIESRGGKVVSSMSSKVTHLINNDNTSTSAKNKAAQAAGIPILTEEEYMEVINA